METTRLGRTDMQVTRLGFGGIPIQTVSREQAIATVKHCYQRGINFFDTARGYTTSEGIIGEALEGVREKIYIASKTPGRDVASVSQHLDITLNNLRTNYLDLYQLHNVVGDEALQQVMAPGGVLDFLKEQQRQGRIRHIGITSHRLDTILQALKSNEFETIQFPFNYIENDAQKELFPLARKMDVGVIVMKPIAGGAMTNPAASIKWILQQTVDVVIPGVESPNLVDANIAAVEAGAPTDEELALLETLAQELGPVFCRRCGYCAPCPNGIPVNFISSAHLFFRRAGWHRMDKSHVEGFKKGIECAGCGVCESRCPYDLPLTKMIPEYSKQLLQRARELGVEE